MVIVAWLVLWSFGNDVGGGLVVVVMVAWLAVVVIVVVAMVAWLALWYILQLAAIHEAC